MSHMPPKAPPEPPEMQPPYRCLFCGAPSWNDPSDQTPPPDYCHESDHGECELE